MLRSSTTRSLRRSWTAFPPCASPWISSVLTSGRAPCSGSTRPGDRLEPENRSRLDEACCKGLLFVSRGQRHIYSKYIIHQLELILLDDNLHSWESASILHEAFADRLARFQEESSGKNLERIRRGAEILAQYLLDDRRRILDLVRVAHERLEAEYEDVLTALIGLALYLEQYGSSLRSGDLERTGLGLFLLDVGMARLPRFITHKARETRTPGT